MCNVDKTNWKICSFLLFSLFVCFFFRGEKDVGDKKEKDRKKGKYNNNLNIYKSSNAFDSIALVLI